MLLLIMNNIILIYNDKITNVSKVTLWDEGNLL